MLGAVCLASDQPASTATDAQDPLAGQVFYYVNRARNGCPAGLGSWGNESSGTARAAGACP